MSNEILEHDEDDGLGCEKRFTWREPVAVLAAVALADTTLYHGGGFAGLALLVLVLPLLCFFGVTKPLVNFRTLLFTGLALLVSLKLIWCGNEFVVLIGLSCVFLFAALQTAVPLRLADLISYMASWFSSAPGILRDYYHVLRHRKTMRWTMDPAKRAAIGVPVGLLLVFGTIFVFANPDLQEKIQYYWKSLLDWIGQFSDWIPAFAQVCLWGGVAWIMLGVLRPRKIMGSQEFYELLQGEAYHDSFSAEEQGEVVRAELVEATPGIMDYVQKRLENPPTKLAASKSVSSSETSSEENPRAVFYYAYFNSLVSLILLFGVYLVFEFAKNWTRDFPEGFNYSQHMHKGALYLTLALALSTIVLCTIFQGKTLLDPRIKTLKRLGVIWTGLNFLLAVAVFNRLYIYIDLNGLSRLRIIGILGTIAVVLGLVMVVRMILLSKGMRWLVYRYTWSVLAVIFIGFVFPFSWYVSHHNVARVMEGDLAPSIFLFPHSLDSPEHYLASLPLLDSEDEVIREGARALFADYWNRNVSSQFSEVKSLSSHPYQWTAFQYSRNLLKRALEERKDEIQPYLDNASQKEETIKTFRKYTNRWI